MNDSGADVCPLCGAGHSVLFAEDKRRPYRRCERCHLVFVPPVFYLSAEREKAEYDLHDNSIADPGYRRFLSRLAAPLIERLPPRAEGLDFGCGPGPALADMFRRAQLGVSLYDIFYYPDASVLERHYDFICATEVVEHLHRPGEVLKTLWHQLRPGGTLAVMTKLVLNAEAFARWHYKNDPTHVVFFSRATFHWLARQLPAAVEFVADDVIFLEKPR